MTRLLRQSTNDAGRPNHTFAQSRQLRCLTRQPRGCKNGIVHRRLTVAASIFALNLFLDSKQVIDAG